MRVYSGAIGTVRYPEAVTFVFNPNTVVVGTDKEVTLMIGEYTDVREPHNTRVEIDIRKYLQAMVSEENRHAGVVVSLVTTDGAFTFTTLAVWGAINVGERYNGSQTVRWWKNYPFTMEVYVPEGATLKSRYDGNTYEAMEAGAGVLEIDPAEMFADAEEKVVLRMEEGETKAVFDMTYDESFRGVGDGVHLYRMEADDTECGVYVRWIDRHGWRRYWLFDEGEHTQADKAGDVLKKVYDGWAYEIETGSYMQKTGARSVKIGASLVDEEQLEQLMMLCTSPVVEVYEAGAWIPVNIEPLTVVRDKKRNPLKDIEMVMTYPELMTQKR